MSVPHRKLSSASTTSTSSLRQIPDFEPDDNWKEAVRSTIDASASVMINEAKEELEKQLKLEPSKREHLIAEFKRTEAEIKRLADEEYLNEIGKERAQRRWASGQPLPERVSAALRSEQQTILDTIQASKNPPGEDKGEGTSSIPPAPSQPGNYPAHESSESEDEESDDEPPASARVAGQRIPPARRPSLDPLRPVPDRSVAPSPSRVHQIWKPSISPEEDVMGRRLSRRASTTSIRSNGSISHRPPNTPVPIPEFSEPEDVSLQTEREKAQSKQAEQQWSTLNRAREKEKEAQRPVPAEGKIASAIDTTRIDNNTRTPSPIPSGATSPPPALPLSTKPSRRTVAPNGQSLLSASRPPADVYPSPSPTPNRHSGSSYEGPRPPTDVYSSPSPTPNRHSGSNYEGPPPSGRYPPPPLHLSTSADSGSTGSYEESPMHDHSHYYGPSSSYEERGYGRPMYVRRDSEQYYRPDFYSPMEHPYARGDPRYDGQYFRPPSSGPPEGAFGPFPRNYYDYPPPPQSARASPYPIPATGPYAGPFAPLYYERTRYPSDLSRRNSAVEYRHSGSVEQDPAWRSWGMDQPRQQYESPEPMTTDLPEEEEPPEVDPEEEERRKAEELRREAEEEEARQKEEARKREEEETLRKKEEEILQKEAETRKKEEDIKKKEEQAKKKEAEIKKKEADAKKKEAEARRKEEEAKRKEQEIRKKEEDARQKAAEAARQAAENQRREQAMRLKEQELLQREAELKRKEREMEERAREEEEKRQQEEQARAEQQRLEKHRQEKERRRLEDERRQQEEERRRLEDERRQQEEEERHRREERRRREEEQRIQEEEERHRREERRRREEEQRIQEDEEKHRKAEQARQEEFKRQENAAAWNNYEAQKQKKAAEAEKRSRQDTLGSESIWAGSPSSSTFSSASSASSRTTTSSSASKSSAWTTWSSSSQTSASSRSSTQSTPKPAQSTASTPKATPTTSTSNANAKGTNEPPISIEEWQRRQEEFARKQQEKFRQEQERLERERLAKTGTMLTKEDVLRLFDTHSKMWAVLKSQTSSELRWDSFPWPTIKKPSGPDDITYAAVDAYIFSPYYPEPDKADKDRVKEHIRKWHPDRFDTKWLPNVIKKDQGIVKEGAGQVVRYLNDLLAKTNS